MFKYIGSITDIMDSMFKSCEKAYMERTENYIFSEINLKCGSDYVEMVGFHKDDCNKKHMISLPYETLDWL